MSVKKTCRFCCAPVNTGSLSSVEDLWERASCLDHRGCLDLLSYSCVNCFAEVLWRARAASSSTRRPESPGYLAQCVARHVADLITKEVKARTRTRKRRTEEITYLPPERLDRKVLMLMLCSRVAGFRDENGRSVKKLVERWGVAGLNKSVSHFRRLRKRAGIKGLVCLKMKRYHEDAGIAREVQKSFFSLRYYRNDATTVEDSLRGDGPSKHFFTGVYFHRWKEIYEMMIYDAVTPLKLRLDHYRDCKQRKRLGLGSSMYNFDEAGQFLGRTSERSRDRYGYLRNR